MADYFESGFCVREPSWHGKELLLADHPESWNEARIAAGLEWDAISAPVFTREIHVGDFGPVENYFEIEGFQSIVRSDTGAVLGMPRSSYSIISHDDMGHLIEAVLDHDNVQFDTAGSVKGGRQVYAVALLDEPIQIPGDKSLTLPYLTVLNAHDGTGACKVIVTHVRVVCANTYSLADSAAEDSGFQVSLRHSGNIEERIEAAAQMLVSARDSQKQYVELATWLSTVPVSDDMFIDFLDEFIPIPDGAEKRTVTNRNNRRGEFTGIYRDSETTDGIRGTGYGLLQTVGEYLDHYRPAHNAETYLSRTMFGTESVKRRALNRVVELCQ